MICLITGVSGGIGGALARTFAEAGWSVVGVDRVQRPDDEHLDAFIEADVARSEDVDRVVSALKEGGRLDAIVNNAAVALDAPIGDITDEQWSAVMDTNVRAAFQLMRENRGLLSESAGAVVNIASVHAIATSVNVAAYAASKGALVALTRAAAVEFAPDRIRVNAVLPGAIATPMLDAGLRRRPDADRAGGNLEELRRRVPLGRVGTPDDVAEAVLFLADTERSGYITGQSLVVDGGATVCLSTE